MSIFGNAGKNIAAGAAPQIEKVIQDALATGTADATTVAAQVILELQTALDAEIGKTFDRVDSIIERIENAVGFAGTVVDGKKLVVTIEVLPK